MKKVIRFIGIPLLVVSISVCLWLYGYHHRKNPDNIPSKELMVTYLEEKGESYASKKIEGYSLSVLSDIWGQPDGELFGLFGKIWETDGNTYFVVYFDIDSCAVNVKLGHHS